MAQEEATLVCQNDNVADAQGGDWQGGHLTVQKHKFCDVFFEKTRIWLNIKGIEVIL